MAHQSSRSSSQQWAIRLLIACIVLVTSSGNAAAAGIRASFVVPSKAPMRDITQCYSSRSTLTAPAKKQRKPKQKAILPVSTNGRRTKKGELNDLVRGMGLNPVERTSIEQEVPKIKIETESEREWEVPVETQLQYARNGHAVLRSLLLTDNNTMIQRLREELVPFAQRKELEAWKQKVEVASNSAQVASECHSVAECQSRLKDLEIDNVPFLQFFNTWKSLGSVKEVTRKSCLPHVAAQLMDVESVRLYQDSLFYKRQLTDGPTPWHSDARMAPFDTSNMITFWIPLQPIPKHGTGLNFVDKSHSDFALPYWNHEEDIEGEYSQLDVRYGGDGAVRHYMPLNMGDVTVHSGWTLHSANGATVEGVDRYALAITYVDARAEIRPDAASTLLENSNNAKSNGKGDNEDRWSFRPWITEVPARTSPFEHDLVPIVWPPQSSSPTIL
mmetsp:Transcript_12949/g.23457  ORF Transcript_12949/g.23457 Transcript_12949/m.23457 type:complete len:444 (-) Transcript_12949:41-1372(-)